MHTRTIFNLARRAAATVAAPASFFIPIFPKHIHNSALHHKLNPQHAGLGIDSRAQKERFPHQQIKKHISTVGFSSIHLLIFLMLTVEEKGFFALFSGWRAA